MIPWYLHTGQQRTSFAELRAAWLVADRLGATGAFLFDHFMPMAPGTPGFTPEEAYEADGPAYEGFTMLGALAAIVPRLRVGVLVAAVGFRNPGLLARIVATLDEVSNGRLELGLGAGWMEREYRAFGIPFPPAGERLEQLEETIQILHHLWSNTESVSFSGRHFRLENAPVAPRPRQRPHPPVWVAGGGERRTIPLAARWADAWNVMYLTPDEFGRKVAVLRREEETAGRPAGSVAATYACGVFAGPTSQAARRLVEREAGRRSIDVEELSARSIHGSPEQIRDGLGRYAAAGCQRLVVMAQPPYSQYGLEEFAEAIGGRPA